MLLILAKRAAALAGDAIWYNGPRQLPISPTGLGMSITGRTAAAGRTSGRGGLRTWCDDVGWVWLVDFLTVRC